MIRRKQSLFAEHAYLPDGWRRDVLLEWDADGIVDGSHAGHCGNSRRRAKAAGPILPGMPNLHSQYVTER